MRAPNAGCRALLGPGVERAEALSSGLLETGQHFTIPSRMREPLTRFMATVGMSGPAACVPLLDEALAVARDLLARGLLALPPGFGTWSEPEAAAELDELAADFGDESADAIRGGRVQLSLEHVWTLRRLEEHAAHALLTRAMAGEDVGREIERRADEGLPRFRPRAAWRADGP